MCDFAGFVVPEIVKIRPVVVVARNRRNRQLVTIVPLSTTGPHSPDAYQPRLSANPLPRRQHIACWAKCDLIATVSLSRLDRFKAGRRSYVTPSLEAADFDAIRQAIVSVLGLDDTSAP